MKYLLKPNRLFIIRLFSIAILSLSIGCIPRIIQHDPMKAARVAVSFADEAFVKRNYARASEFVTNDDPSGSHTKEIVALLHPSGSYPVSVKAIAYEPVPGSSTTKIFIDGKRSDAQVLHYCLVLVQANETYKVQDVLISADGNPFSKTDFTRDL